MPNAANRRLGRFSASQKKPKQTLRPESGRFVTLTCPKVRVLHRKCLLLSVIGHLRWQHRAPIPMCATMKIAIASDHAAIALKSDLREWLIDQGHEVADLGPDSAESVDYPDFGYLLASVVADGTAERGIALCGSGIGISIAVNRNPAVRCALVSEPLSASLSRQHNDANVLAMGARLTGPDMARACITAFLETAFEGGRHQRRVDKLSTPVQKS